MSGGQTGVDRAALIVAKELGLSCRGWCPKGRRAEDGPIDPAFILQETPSENYAQRTEWNVRDSDGTLIFTEGRPSGGTACTIRMAQALHKPWLLLDLLQPPDPSRAREWIRQPGIHILNVAGPRKSTHPGIFNRAAAFLRQVLTAVLLLVTAVPDSFGDSTPLPVDLHAEAQGTWTKRQGLISQETGPGRPESGGEALVLTYDVSGERQEAGFWYGLSGINLSGYGAVTFWIKGAAGGETAAFGLKDTLWSEQKLPIEAFLPHGITTSWQRVTIPLDAWASMSNWHEMDNLTFSFHWRYGPPFRGTVSIADLSFINARTGVERPTPIRYSRPPLESMSEEEFLELVQRAAAMFFWFEADPATGLIKDRSYAVYRDGMEMASIASVGFGLPALCIAHRRGWLPEEAVVERIRTTLRFLKDHAEQHRGFYYHFMQIDTGERWGDAELSSIDTALLMAGVLFAGEYFNGTEIEAMAKALYERVEWDWMMNSGEHPSMGWKPESGFLSYRWTNYAEHAVLLLLGIGSPTHPMPAQAWRALKRPKTTYQGHTFVGPGILFIHQYSHLFIDFRGLHDGLMDYFDNSVQATLANRRWAIEHMGSSKTYGPDAWGLTASDGPSGYRPFGAQHEGDDGTIAPTAAAGSIVFTPEFSIRALKHFYQQHGERIWGRYGFVDAVNVDQDWVSSFHIGINEGPIVLMIENYRTGLIWRHFMRNTAVRRGLERCGLKPLTGGQEPPVQPTTTAPSEI